MRQTRFFPVAVASMAANFADQMMLALLPLLLVATGATAATVSVVIAAHAAAWLLVALPVGAFADVISRRSLMVIGSSTIMAAALMGAVAVEAGVAPPLVLAFAAFGIAAGVVTVVLSVFAVLPRTLAQGRLAAANATLEFGRATAAIAAPTIAAVLVSQKTGALGFLFALTAGIAALAATLSMPSQQRVAAAPISFCNAIRDGVAFVLQQPILRSIAICAILWNAAFFALTAVFASYATTELGLTVAEIGNAWSIYGVGLLLGSLAATPMIARLPTGTMFVFGPAVSALASVVLLTFARNNRMWLVAAAFFSLGFAPMTWLVLQTSVRQLVTPDAKLGRVGATLTMAIYGVRPLGALAAGQIATGLGAKAALTAATLLFVASALAVATSPAARLKALPPSRA